MHLGHLLTRFSLMPSAIWCVVFILPPQDEIMPLGAEVFSMTLCRLSAMMVNSLT